MKKTRVCGMLLLIALLTSPEVGAQTSEMRELFNDFGAREAAGSQRDVAEADPALQHLLQSSKEDIKKVLPAILQAAGSPYVSVRRISASALWELSTRTDVESLVAAEPPTLSALLVDSDIPVRRLTVLTIYTLWPFTPSPMVPLLKSYLSREDAVETIGPAVAGVLMQTVPNDAESMRAVVQFMHRPDQTAESQEGLMNSISIAKCHNADIAREVARYAETSDEQMSVLAIETLGGMGRSAVMDNQRSIVRVAGDTTRPQTVRAAAAKALSAFQ